MALEGRVAIVTGGARGIGRATAEALLDSKVKVCITDIVPDENAFKELCSKYGEINIIYKVLDVTKKDCFEEVIKEVKEHFNGRFDILINNAGILDENNFELMVDINVKGPVYGIKLAQQHMVGSDGKKEGNVINLCSVAGLKPSFLGPVYSATKCAVYGMTLTFGHPDIVKKTQVKVSAICPDVTDTAIFSKMPNVLEKTAELRGTEIKILQPSDISRGIIKLLQDDMSGEFLVVSRSKGTYYYEVDNTDCLLYDNVI